MAEYDELQKQLRRLVPQEDKVKNVDKFAQFMTHVADTWKEGTQEQRNKMANVLFERIWIEDNRVAEVKPRDELRLFFQLSHEEHLQKSNKRPRGASTPYVQYVAYSVEVLCPSSPSLIISRRKLAVTLWPEIVEQYATKSLRELAKEYGVSHEAVRRIIMEDRQSQGGH